MENSIQFEEFDAVADDYLASAVAELRASLTEAQENLVGGEKSAPFIIDTPDKVDWYMRRLAAIDAESAAIKANAERILGGLAKQRASLVEHFSPDVKQVARWMVYEDPSNQKIDKNTGEKTPRKKSFLRLWGTIGMKMVTGGWKLASGVANERAAIAHAEAEFPDLVTTRFVPEKVLDLEGYKAKATELGEVLPGLEYIAPGDELVCKPGAKGE